MQRRTEPKPMCNAKAIIVQLVIISSDQPIPDQKKYWKN